MANEFKIKKGLIVTGADGGTVVDIQGSQGQLFSVTDDLSGSIFAVSDISGVPILDVNSSGTVTIDGLLTGDDATFSKRLTLNSPDYAQHLTMRRGIYGYDTIITGTRVDFSPTADTLSFKFLANLQTTGDVTVSGGDLNVGSSTTVNSVINMLGTNDSFIEKDTGNHLYFANNVSDKDIRFRVKDDGTNVIALTIDGPTGGNSTFAAQAFSAATSSGDASSTLTTKGYVDGLITGATIYRGAWDPSGGGYGSPDLSGVTQTSGYYYICSAAGTAEPNGTGTEPDTWETGDWVIYNDVSGTGQWQKIDNSSVLSGVGTGQTVALWEGAGSVTDSETLGNAPITVSGNNTTFAGTVTGTTGTFTGNLAVGNTSAAEIYLNRNSANYINASNAAGYLVFRTGGTGTALTLSSSQVATFTGTVNADLGIVASGAMSSFETTLTNNDDWQNSPISILERGNVQGTQTADKYAPNLNFHWGGKFSASLWMSTNGHLHYGQYGATGIPASDGTINAATFLGELGATSTINTGVTGATQTAGNNSTLIATTAYADAAAAAVDPSGVYLPLTAGSGSSLTDNLYINDVDQNNVNRYGNLSSEVGFTRSPVTGNPNQWFKVVTLAGSPKRIKFSIIATGDNTNSYDNFLISTSGYGMNMHIEKLPGGKYNTSKLLSVAAINPSNSSSVEIWIKLLPVYSNTGATYVACTSDVLASATILASATTTAPTLTANDTQLDISNDNRLYATLQASRGATFGAKVGIGTNAPAAMLTVAGDSTISGNVGIGTTSTSYALDVEAGATGDLLGNSTTAAIFRAGRQNVWFQNQRTVAGNDWNNNTFKIIAKIDTTSHQSINFVNDASYNEHIDIYTGNQVFNTRFNANGNVGIGTTSPNTLLDVSSANSGTTAPTIRITNTLNTGDWSGVTSDLGRFEFFTDDSSGNGPYTLGYIGIKNDHITGTPTLPSGAMVFATTTYNASGGAVERMRIDSSGNVGIGTDNPRDILEIVGNMRFVEGEDHLMIKPNSNIHGADFIVGDGVAATDTPVMSLNGLYGGQVTIQTQGNTIADKTVLDVQGTQGQLFSVTDNLSGDIFSVADISGVPIMNVNSSGVSYFDGKVGIGIDNPTVMLQVDGNAYIGTGATDDNLSLRVYGNNAGASRYVELAHTNASSSRVKTDNSYLSLESAGYILLSNSGLFYGDTLILNNKRIKYGESNGSWRDVMYLGTDNVFRIGTISTMSSGGDTAMYHSGSEKVRINSTGVGIGTTSPGAKLEVEGDATSDDTPQLIVASGGADNNAIIHLTDDAGGQVNAIGALEGNMLTFASLNEMIFKTGTGSILGNTDTKMTIDTNGDVGIGVTDPLVKLHVNQGNTSGTVIKASGIQAQIEIQTSTAGDAHLYMRPNTTGNNAAIFKMTAGTDYNWRWQDDVTTPVVFMQLSQSNSSLSVKGDIIAYGSPSDERYKENIKPIESALDKAVKLQGVTFDWKETDSILDIKEDIGFIAQDVQKVVPELVRENEDGKLSLRYQGVTPILLEAIKELKAEIDLLKSKPCNCNNCNCSI